MSAEEWAELSSWHNAWLVADPPERERLRERLAGERPHLLATADSLAKASDALPEFLTTPAFLLAAKELADEEQLLEVGTGIGPYRIVSLLARGGMGDVYRATDVRLARDVALKLLQTTDTRDARRLERFTQEARVTAALDHPNIVRVFDVGIHQERPFIVWELLEGETLRARVSRGPLAPDEARRIAADLAEGLVAAHASGLVHRDLKPENIFITHAGDTKILDFGIAKLTNHDIGAAGLSTLPGVLLGTVGYLAPEQIRGESVDERADLFALGAIVYEMLTGARAFQRPQAIDTLHAILHEPAPELTEPASSVSHQLGQIVERLLEKAPDARFQSARDLVWAIEHLGTPPAMPGRGPVRETGHSVTSVFRWVNVHRSVAAVAIVAAAVTGWLIARRSIVLPPAQNLTRVTLQLPAGVVLDSAPMVAPDGRRVVFVGKDANGARLYLRELGALEATPILGTEGALQPFWSPDGSMLAYFARGKLMKMPLGGGPPVALADAPEPMGGAWSSNGTIVFGPVRANAALSKVSSGGGAVQPATLLGDDPDEMSHRWPTFLPDGVHFLYLVRARKEERRGVYVARLDRPAALPDKPLITSDSDAMYVALPAQNTGAILYVADNVLVARPFDPARLEFTGEQRPIAPNVGTSNPHYRSVFAAAPDVVASAPGIPTGSKFATMTRDGKSLRLWPESATQNWPRLSPDGGRLGFWWLDPVTNGSEIWVENLARGTRMRISSLERATVPVWSPDGRWMAHRSGTSKESYLQISAADGSGDQRKLRCPTPFCDPTEWTPDGNLLVNAYGPNIRADIWSVSIERDAAQPVIAEPFTERDARLSPDGQSLAYVSNESGRPEVFVRRVRGATHRAVISKDGGDQPVWRRDGRELFYLGPDYRPRSVTVRTMRGGVLEFGAPVALNLPPFYRAHWGTEYDVSADGQRFYFLQANDAPPPREIHLALGWTVLLK